MATRIIIEGVKIAYLDPEDDEYIILYILNLIR